MIYTRRKKQVVYLSITKWCSTCKRTTTFVKDSKGQYVCQSHT